MIYALSDIHGNERRFNSVLEQINLRESDSLYVLGDVVDRHPGGIRLLKRIMSMPNAHMLLGNHEHMMLRALGHPYNTKEILSDRDALFAQMLWHQNGGYITHQCWNRLSKDIQTEIVDYLRGLPLNIDIEVNGQLYKLVHGAPVEEYTEWSGYEDAVQFAVWERPDYEHRASGDYTLLFGHTPTEHYQSCIPMEPWYGHNCIGVDCGCGYPETGFGSHMGRLACVRLDDGKVYYSDEANTLKCCA